METVTGKYVVKIMNVVNFPTPNGFVDVPLMVNFAGRVDIMDTQDVGIWKTLQATTPMISPLEDSGRNIRAMKQEKDIEWTYQTKAQSTFVKDVLEDG